MLFLIIIFVIVIYYIKINKIPKELENIPYVPSYSVLWALIRQLPQDEIQEKIRESSKGHDIYLSKVGPKTYVNIIGPDHVKDLLMASEDIAPKVPENVYSDFFGNGLIFSNHDLWRSSRKLANSAFNSALSPEKIGDPVMKLLSFIQQNSNQPLDVFGFTRRVTLEILGTVAFGHKFGTLDSLELPHIVKIYQSIITTVIDIKRVMLPWLNKLPTEHNKKFRQAIKEFDSFIYDIIEERRNKINNNKISDSERSDLLTIMLKYSEQEDIYASTKQIRDDMANLFVAGHDTTAMTLSTIFYYLAKYPEIQERARAEAISILGNKPIIPSSDQIKEMKYITAVIKETLRILPPATMITIRSLTKPTKIGPYLLPENTYCAANIWAIQHDPKHWENPNQYNPERFLNNDKRHPFAWIPFASGPRNCVGQNFALLEQKVILSMMLLKFSWDLPKNTIHKEKLIIGSQFFTKPIDLRIKFTERN